MRLAHANAADKKAHIRRRAIELAAEIALAAALVAGISIYAIYGPEESFVDAKWIAFAVNTAFVFGYALKYTRPLWRNLKLWAVLCGVLFLHGIVGWSVISKVERIPLVWYIPADLAEIWAALLAVGWAFSDDEMKC